MAEYIDRKALIQKIDEGFDKTDPDGEEQIGFLRCRRIARELPASDVAPVVRGRWMHHENGIAYCSNCEMDAVEDGTNFCPNCGADMREG